MYEGRTAAEPGITFGKIRVEVWSNSSAESIKGHENMGIVEELGEGVISLKKGDRVVMPFNVADGRCRNCEEGKTAFCTGVNPGFAGGAYGELCLIQRCELSFFWANITQATWLWGLIVEVCVFRESEEWELY